MGNNEVILRKVVRATWKKVPFDTRNLTVYLDNRRGVKIRIYDPQSLDELGSLLVAREVLVGLGVQFLVRSQQANASNSNILRN